MFRFFLTIDQIEGFSIGPIIMCEKYCTLSLGSVRLLIDESGDVANNYTYEPYGELIATESAVTTANPFKFTGQWLDEEIDQYYPAFLTAGASVVCR